MKHLYKSIFIFILSVHICVGQKVFKVKDGELQFIHPEEGIFIKKNNAFYQLRLQKMDDYEALAKGFEYELKNVDAKKIESLKKDTLTVLVSDITQFDFKKFDHQKFTTKNKDDDNYRFYRYNKNFFSVAVLEDSLQKPVNKYLLHYCILDFGNNKKVLYTKFGFVVPTKEKIKFLFNDFQAPDFDKDYTITEFKTLEASEIHTIDENGDLMLNRGFYRIDTLKNKQLQIKDIYKDLVINKSFDSIACKGYFIAGYKNNKIDLYNFIFQKFKLKNISAFSFDKFSPGMQIIENNELRRINLAGTTYKKSDVAYQMSYSHFFPPILLNFKITQKEDYFYFETDKISLLHYNVNNDRIFKLKNSNEFKTVEYLDENLTAFTIDSEMDGFTLKDPIIIYTQLKNGKFNLNSLEYLITKNPTKEVEDFNNSLPKDLDSISPIEQNYLIEKNGLFTYYPLVKKMRYKKLGEFQYNFARFELPNGQKGWLDLKGKEYLDK